MTNQNKKKNLKIYVILILIVIQYVNIFYIGKDKAYNQITITNGTANISRESYKLNKKNYLVGEWRKNSSSNEIDTYSIDLYSEVDIYDTVVYIELFLPSYKIYVDNKLVSWSSNFIVNNKEIKQNFNYEYIYFNVEKGKTYNIKIELEASDNSKLHRTPILDTFINKKNDFLKKIIINNVVIGILISSFFITIVVSIISKSNRFNYRYPAVILFMLLRQLFTPENILINGLISKYIPIEIISKSYFIINFFLVISLTEVINEVFKFKKENILKKVLLYITYYAWMCILFNILRVQYLGLDNNVLVFIVLILFILTIIPIICRIVRQYSNSKLTTIKIIIFINYSIFLANIYLSNINIVKEYCNYDFILLFEITGILFIGSVLYFYANEIKKADEKSLHLDNIKKKLIEKNTTLLLSQIKPHFIYNTLATVQSMIKLNPEEAYKSMGIFSKYLRANMNSINYNNLIDIEMEINHVKLYAEIEKIRFEERVNVFYDIKAKNYNVPAFTIQPLVENAIKHGICKKTEGGIIQVKTYEYKNKYFITIVDNGIGFNIEEIRGKEDSLGIKNIRYRLKSLMQADLVIESEKNKGTKATIIIPKNT